MNLRATIVIPAAIAVGLALGRLTSSREAPPARIIAPAHEVVLQHKIAATTSVDVATRNPMPAETAAVRPLYERWQRLSAEPASPARDDELVRALEELAAVDPARARSIADSETHPWRRQRLASAAVRGWARSDGAAAIEWVLQQPAGAREELLHAAFAGAAVRPDELIPIVERVCAAEPVFARERGAAAIDALAHAGAFAPAAQFAIAGPAEYRDPWLAAAYARWAEHQPESAVAAAVALQNETARRIAIDAVVKGWAQTEPATLAEFARHMPADATRTYALGEALRQWIDMDPVSAARWIDQWPAAASELDDAVAAIAQQPYLATTQPEVAISWAESIQDPNVRRTTLLAIAQKWATVDRTAARRYVEQLSELPVEQRKDLLGLLQADR